EVSQRMGTGEVSPAHVLVALLNDTRGSGRRCLEVIGVDPSLLRTAAVHLGMGIIGRRRKVGIDDREPEPLTPLSGISPISASTSTTPRGVAVPLVPPMARPQPSDPRQPGMALPVVPQVGPAPLARLKALVSERPSRAPEPRVSEDGGSDVKEPP